MNGVVVQFVEGWTVADVNGEDIAVVVKSRQGLTSHVAKALVCVLGLIHRHVGIIL